MGLLLNLEGVKAKKLECEFFNKPKGIRPILRKGMAATTADSNGALNIWRDDERNIRCCSMRYMRTLENKKYKTLTDAEKWAKRWLKKIK